MSNLDKKFKEEIRGKLQKDLGFSSVMAVPKVEKVTLNVGIGKFLKDKQAIEQIEEDLIKISGQKPVKTRARVAIAAFKIREGLVVGMSVTLRGKRMYDFLERLVKISLPRIRDFQGLSATSFDDNGNYSIGLSEQEIFPEVVRQDVGTSFGFEINITTTAKNEKDSRALLEALGFPLVDKEVKKGQAAEIEESQEERAAAAKERGKAMVEELNK